MYQPPEHLRSLWFSDFLRQKRKEAGYGLREFARLIGESNGNYAARESGRRGPWRDFEKQVQVARALRLQEGSPEWDDYFLRILEGRPCLPIDLLYCFSNRRYLAIARQIQAADLNDTALEWLAQGGMQKLLEAEKTKKRGYGQKLFPKHFSKTHSPAPKKPKTSP